MYVNVNYDDLTKNRLVFIDYAFKNSNTFALCFYANNPNNKENIVYGKPQIASLFSPFLFKQYVRGDKIYRQIQHKSILNIYHCNKIAKANLKTLNVFIINYDCGEPEDLCFFKNDELWFESIYHERIARIYNVTKEEIEFLTANNIKFGL